MNELTNNLAKAQGIPGRWSRSISDIVGGLLSWRVWWLLGSNDIRARYRRSAFGQLWLTLSMAITIGALGVLYAFLFKMDVQEYLPFIAVSIILWQFMASMITDGCLTFVGAESYIKNIPLPLATYAYRVVARNVIVFLHNAILIPIIFIMFEISPSWSMLLVIPGLLLLLLNGAWIGLVLGAFCARYRDMPPIVANLMQLAFFLSPVIWKPAQIGIAGQAFLTYNPFNYLLAVVREPMLGNVPTATDYTVVIGITLAGIALAVFVFARVRARIVYWL